MINAHASSISDYVSHLRVTNTGAVAGPATLVLRDAANGTSVGRWYSPTIPPGGSVETTIPDIEAAVTNIAASTRVGTEQYNVSLENLPGYLQHVMENRKVAALTDMTAKCDLPVSPAVVAPTTTPPTTTGK